MSPLIIVVATVALGIEVGWKPLAEGGHEYTIAIEPGLLDVLKQGDHEITSDIPPGLDVRSYRIICGTAKLPRIDGPAAQSPVHDAPATPAQPQIPSVPPARGPLDETEPSAAHSTAVEPEPPIATTASESHAAPLGAPHELPLDAGPKPLENRPAAFNTEPETVDTKKPELKGGPPHTTAEEPRPWLPFLISAGLLCCSLGANLYLGWIAWDARSRYRNTLSKLRPASAT